MAGETRQSAEVLGHDRNRKVPSAGLASRVSGMRSAVVLNLEHRRRKLREAFFEFDGNGRFHGAGSDI